MDATQAARDSAGAIVGLPARFMMDGATYARGGELGFDGVDFYFAGRGGALGDTCGAVVAAAFVFFNPETVCEAWARTEKVMGRVDAANAFAGCSSTWAASHLADGVDYARLAELCGRVVRSASPAALPLFAAWADLPEPEDDKALALHRVNLLRELRGGLHGAAVLAAGLDPRDAVMVHTPYMAGLFGWGEPDPDAEPHRPEWDRAEALTDSEMARTLGVLASEELAELVGLLSAAEGAAS
ncbi:MAG TPA: hypothetical protein VMR97_03600 [Acidimicrobiales bacterium]|nr:hypothetical protein [Acidimicrobiales bacterium]